MATKPLRGPSLSSAFREMHIETRGRHHSAPTRAAVRTWGNRAGSRLGGGAPEDAASCAPRVAEPPLVRHTTAWGHLNSKIANQKHEHQKHGTRQVARTGARLLGCRAPPAGARAL